MFDYHRLNQFSILSIVSVGDMDSFTTCYIWILRLIWWTNVSSSSGDTKQKTSWIDSRRRALWKV